MHILNKKAILFIPNEVIKNFAVVMSAVVIRIDCIWVILISFTFIEAKYLLGLHM